MFRISFQCNFLQNFKSCLVGQSANKKQKIASKILTALWIQFLLVLSFFADGTNAILKNDSKVIFQNLNFISQ